MLASGVVLTGSALLPASSRAEDVFLAAGAGRMARLQRRAGRRGSKSALCDGDGSCSPKRMRSGCRGRKLVAQSGSVKQTLRRMKEWIVGNF